MNRALSRVASARSAIPGSRQILIVAGEASADRYGARLIEKLRGHYELSGLEVYGTGGDDMQGAGVRLLCHVRDLASIGPHAALSNLFRYIRVYRKIVRACRMRPPDVAVLMDFPEFNLRLVRHLKRSGTRVIYYVGPQMWAWRQGRVRTVRRYVDKMAVILPFEENFYRNHGIAAEFVGHPLLEDFSPNYDRDQVLRPLGFNPECKAVALLSGSRRHEVEHILPLLLRTSLRIRQRIPAQFLVSIAPTIRGDQVEGIMEQCLSGADRSDFRMVAGPARDLLACSDFALVKSGTSTLEAALVGIPFLITYKVSPASWCVGNILIRGQLKGLVNLIAGEEIVPELLQSRATPERLAEIALDHLCDPGKAGAMRARLREVRSMLGARGASDAVAAMVREYL